MQTAHAFDEKHDIPEEQVTVQAPEQSSLLSCFVESDVASLLYLPAGHTVQLPLPEDAA